MGDQKDDLNDQTGSLVEKAIDGDQEAIATLYKLYETKMITLVHYKLGHTLHGLMESVDLVQSLWKDVLDDIQDFEYRGPDSFFSWLRACLVNKIHTKRRYHVAEKRDQKKVKGLQDGEVPAGKVLHVSPDPTPSQAVSSSEEMDRLLEVLEEFPSLQKRVLILRLTNELGYEEIGKKIGKSTEATKKLYQRGLKKLITLLPEEWRSDGDEEGGKGTA